MRLLFLLIGSFLFTTSGFTQVNINATVGGYKLYYYPKFVQGKVHFKDSRVSSALLNYNLFVEEMQFVDNKGDTLSIGNVNDIDVLVLGNDSFYFNQGYLKLVASANQIKLASKQKSAGDILDKKGPYGGQVQTSSMNKYNTLNATQFATSNVNVNEIGYKGMDVEYFITANNNVFMPATKRNFVKLARRNKKEAEEYLNRTNFNFSKEEDSKKALFFIASLR